MSAPPPATGGSATAYTSASALEHWWRPGYDTEDLGRDFANGGGVDAFAHQTGLKATDLMRVGSSSSEVDLDGKKEALGNFKLATYGLGDSWSLAAWVRPVKLPKKANKPAYLFDLNGARSKKSVNRISLMLDSNGHFGIEVSDALGRSRAIASANTLNPSQLGRAWYHVVAVKTASSDLRLYVNGVLVASTPVGIPTQADVPRALRIGGRVKSSKGFYFNGGIGSLGLWRTPLRPNEVRALYGNGNRTRDLRSTLILSR